MVGLGGEGMDPANISAEKSRVFANNPRIQFIMMQKVIFSLSLITNCCHCCYYKDSCCRFPVLFPSLPTFQSNNTAVKGTQTAG